MQKLKPMRKIRLVMTGVIVFIFIGAAASVVGPVRSFKDKCDEFFSFGIDEKMKEIQQFYEAYLNNVGLVAEDLENLPFDSDIIGQAIAYDINGGNITYADGLEVCYRSYKTETDVIVTTETVETEYKHLDGRYTLLTRILERAGCDNYSARIEISSTGKKVCRYYCDGHTITQEIEHKEELTKYLTYGHYFTIKPSDYLGGYDMPWNVTLALAVVQKYAYNGGLEIDDYTGDEEFKYKLTKKGIKKIHDMFSSDMGVQNEVKFSYLPYAIMQEDVKKMEFAGRSEMEIKASEEYKNSILNEEDILLRGTYYYENSDSEHPSLSIVITDIYNYIWHYHYEYDYSSGLPIFSRGSRTSRVENFRQTLEKNKFDEDAPDLLIALVDAMPGGEETASTLQFLFDYYDDSGEEYTEELYDGIVYRMKQTDCKLIEQVNEG